jgi:hypothetical protein
MTTFLPNTQCMDIQREEEMQYTICLLVPASKSSGKAVAGNTKDAYVQPQFADPDDYITFRQTIMPSSVDLSKKQRLQFARAMRILALRPYFHLTEMQKVITPAIRDSDLLEICACSSPTCSCDKNLNLCEKILRLERYLAKKNTGKWHPLMFSSCWSNLTHSYLELAGQSWPQLTMFAPSQAFSPN